MTRSEFLPVPAAGSSSPGEPQRSRAESGGSVLEVGEIAGEVLALAREQHRAVLGSEDCYPVAVPLWFIAQPPGSASGSGILATPRASASFGGEIRSDLGMESPYRAGCTDVAANRPPAGIPCARSCAASIHWSKQLQDEAVVLHLK